MPTEPLTTCFTSRSPLDIKRQRATWELGVILHQNESQGAASVAAAKAVYSQAVLEAKTIYRTTIMEAKTTRCHSIQAAEVVCSKAISEAEAWEISQAIVFQEEHSKHLQSLEEQAFGEESRSCYNILSSCQATLCHSPQPLRGALAALYHLLLGQAPPSLPSYCLQGPPPQKSSHLQLLPLCQHLNSLQDQKGSFLCQSQWGTCPWVEPPWQLVRGTSPPQEVREPSLVQVTEAQLCWGLPQGL